MAPLVGIEIGTRMHGTAIVPEKDVADPPLVGIDEVRLFDLIEQHVQESPPLIRGQPFDAIRHQSVDVERGATGLGMNAPNRVRIVRQLVALGAGGRSAESFPITIFSKPWSFSAEIRS